ncbi:hypothetical protein SAMN04515671_3540 [Nakamurella panacisegetis]|uniref:Uncharacterized protein n=2 Tax=Nakamurella panacisegetis TaxID=1090615 RepID=A0A1H0REZ5_9ACTN|nr:hypothetical protein SAMN04515671_3540 [Nakamurella panacisegetis]
MVFQAPDPVPAGQAFDVIAVNGRTPHELPDFVGEAAFTIQATGQDRLVTGSGSITGSVVRFHEKDVDHGGKDVRVWLISPTEPPGQFTARTSQ